MIPIHVQLRVSTPGLQVKRNPQARAEGLEDRREYVIGSGPDVLLQCPAEGIAPRHCVVIMTAREVCVRDLGSETGTFVNGERVEGERRMRDADRLKVGPLELVVEIDDPTLVDDVYTEPSADREGEAISEWLLHQDETEWELRRQQPELRRFSISRDELPSSEPAESSHAPTGTNAADAPSTPAKHPARLPIARKPQAPDSVNAAAGALRKLGIRIPDVLRGTPREPRSN